MPKELLVAVAATVVAITTPACAGFINLNAPRPPGPTFTPLPGNMVEVSAPGGWGGTVAGYIRTSTIGLELENAVATFGPLDLIGQLSSSSVSGTESVTFDGTIFDPSGNGNAIETNHLTGTITWNSFSFAGNGLPGLSGTGIVNSSSGGADFETDFPINGTFSVGAAFGAACLFLPFSCSPNLVEATFLLNGSITPVAAPSPPIGLPLLIGAALLVFVKRFWRSPMR